MSYQARVVEGECAERLQSAGALVIEGAKACGKTSTARRFARSEIQLDLDASTAAAIDVAPALALDGATPRLVDEWQVVPSIWNQVRRTIDDRQQRGQFILTGSAVPNDDVSRHTGAGRFSFVRMRPMALCESGHSSKTVLVSALREGAEHAAPDPGLSIDDVAERIIVGGWPGSLGQPLRQGARASADYLRQMVEVDVERIAVERRDPERVRRLVHAVARSTSTEATLRTLATDADVSDKAAEAYLSVLERLMILEQQPAWSTSLKSRARLRRAPRHHLVDPSLAAAALGVRDTRDLLRQSDLFGQLFESLVVRDLRVLTQPLDGRVFHYRDSNQLEVDIVVEFPGAWAAVEVKLNPRRVDAAATSLLRLAEVVDPAIRGKPVFLMVVTAVGPSYVRPDGVHVVSIGSLAA